MYNQKIATAAINAILESQELDVILWENENCQKASKKLSQVLEETQKVCPEPLYDRLKNAVIGYSCCGNVAAILCGMQIASSLYQITASPRALSEFVEHYMSGEVHQ